MGGIGRNEGSGRAGLRCLHEHASSVPVAALLMGYRGRLSVSYPPQRGMASRGPGNPAGLGLRTPPVAWAKKLKREQCDFGAFGIRLP